MFFYIYPFTVFKKRRIIKLLGKGASYIDLGRNPWEELLPKDLKHKGSKGLSPNVIRKSLIMVKVV